jgi:hypothetical protein
LQANLRLQTFNLKETRANLKERNWVKYDRDSCDVSIFPFPFEYYWPYNVLAEAIRDDGTVQSASMSGPGAEALEAGGFHSTLHNVTLPQWLSGSASWTEAADESSSLAFTTTQTTNSSYISSCPF